MFVHTTSEHLGEALTKALHHWEIKHSAEEAPAIEPQAAFTITISREAGSKGSIIAHAIGEKLGWPVYDRELLKKIADEKGLRVQLVESLDEKKVNWLRKAIEEFSLAPGLTEEAYVHYLTEALFSLSALGECVIVGRGAAQILPAASTFRVRLIRPKKDRIAFISKKFALSKEDAERWVDRTDRERAAFVKEHYYRDPGDALNYDLVLNTSRFSTEAAVDLIVEALQKLVNGGKKPSRSRK